MADCKSRGDFPPEQVQQIMKTLQISEQEAQEVLDYDKRIDAGEKLGELSAEQKKVAKEMTITTSARTKPTYKFQPREKKANMAKQEIIAAIAQMLESKGAEKLEIANAEREFSFLLDNVKYKIVLSCPRK